MITFYLNDQLGSLRIQNTSSLSQPGTPGCEKVLIGDSPFFTLDNTGNLNITGTVFHASDQRYKKNIQAISTVLPQLMQIGAYHYDWKLEEFPHQRFTSERQLGFLAQELEAAFPELVHTNSAGYKSVDYSRMGPILVEAIKEQQTQIDQLKAEKAALET